jgi:hypothetical protein
LFQSIRLFRNFARFVKRCPRFALHPDHLLSFGAALAKILRAEHAVGLIELASLGSVFKANMRERAIYTEPFVHGYTAFEDKRNGDAASEDVFAIWAEAREKLGA